MTEPTNEPTADQAEQLKKMLARRRKRSIALGIILAVIVVAFYALTIVKMGPELLNRQL